MKSFAELLQQLAIDVYGQKQQNRYFTGPAPDCDDSVCWLCEQSLEPSDKVSDHCHTTGQFLGFAHSKCKLRRRTVNYIPVVTHNLYNYDLHHICKNLHYFSDDCRIQVIPPLTRSTSHFQLVSKLRPTSIPVELRRMCTSTSDI